MFASPGKFKEVYVNCASGNLSFTFAVVLSVGERVRKVREKARREKSAPLLLLLLCCVRKEKEIRLRLQGCVERRVKEKSTE